MPSCHYFVRSKLKRILSVAAVGVFLAVLVWVSVTREPPVFPPLPNPNGFDDFLKAASLYPDAGPVYETLTYSNQIGLHAFIATNAEVLQLVRVGLSRTCSVPTEVALTNFTSHMPALADLKRLAHLQRGAGRLAEMEGRTNDAVRCYLEGIQFGNEISRGGFILHRLVGIACEAIGEAGLTGVLPSLACDQARPCIAKLEELDRTAISWEEVAKTERIFARYEAGKSANPIRWITEWWQLRDSIKTAKSRHENIFARRRLLMVELALRCYEAESNQPPARLDDLVPKYLSRVPEDPFTGKALIYRPQGTNWLLYSIGPDGVDDGGKPAARSGPGGKKIGDLFFYSP